MGAKRDLYLHGVVAYVIKRLIIVYAMGVGEFKGLQFTHGVPPVKGDRPAFRLGRADHPVEEIGGAGAFEQQVDGPALGHCRRLPVGIGHLTQAKSAVQHIYLFSIHF